MLSIALSRISTQGGLRWAAEAATTQMGRIQAMELLLANPMVHQKLDVGAKPYHVTQIRPTCSPP